MIFKTKKDKQIEKLEECLKRAEARAEKAEAEANSAMSRLWQARTVKYEAAIPFNVDITVEDKDRYIKELKDDMAHHLAKEILEGYAEITIEPFFRGFSKRQVTMSVKILPSLNSGE